MIFYQRTNDGITLVINRDSAVEIANWDRTIEYPRGGSDLLHGNSEGNYELSLTVHDHDVVVGVKPYTLKNSFRSFFFKGCEASDLSSRSSTWCPSDLRSAQEVVLVIRGGGAYQSLKVWDHWIDNEAFTGRYTYAFSSGECEVKTVLDQLTSESWKFTNFWGPE